MTLKPVVELGVAEAYAILAALPGVSLPPLEAIENEDWGRDFLLGRFEEFSTAELTALGLRWEDGTEGLADDPLA